MLTNAPFRLPGVESSGRATDLGPVDELMRGKVDLSEGAFANQSTKRVVAHGLEFLVREFTGRKRRVSELLLCCPRGPTRKVARACAVDG